MAVATGLIALLSAVITATLGHWYSRSAEQSKRTAEARREHARRVREQVSAVATDIAAMLEEVRPLNEQLAIAGFLDGAELSEGAASAVRKSHFKALPNIEVLDDDALRRAADDVFVLRETWFAENSQALVNQTPQPSVDEAVASTDVFFKRAREVIGKVESE